MSLEQLLGDIRRIGKQPYFQSGQRTAVTKTNNVIDAWNRLVDAANQNDGGDGGGLPQSTFTGWVVKDGVSTLYTLVGQPASE